MENLNINEIAKLICQYNGQKGTEKQIQRCIKNFKGSIDIMRQFCEGRIGIVEIENITTSNNVVYAVYFNGQYDSRLLVAK